MDVAGAALRIGAIPGFKKAAESRARESYWTALFRARRQGSLNGVLDAAEAFGALGDRVMVEQCVRIAERLATLITLTFQQRGKPLRSSIRESLGFRPLCD